MQIMIIKLKGFNPETTSIDPILRNLRTRMPGKEVHGDWGKIFIMSMDLSEIPETIVEEVVRAAGYEYEIESADGIQRTAPSLLPPPQPVASSHKEGKRPWWKFWAREGFLCKKCNYFVAIASLPKGSWLWSCPKCHGKSLDYVKR